MTHLNTTLHNCAQLFTTLQHFYNMLAQLYNYIKLFKTLQNTTFHTCTQLYKLLRSFTNTKVYKSAQTKCANKQILFSLLQHVQYYTIFFTFRTIYTHYTVFFQTYTRFDRAFQTQRLYNIFCQQDFDKQVLHNFFMILYKHFVTHFHTSLLTKFTTLDKPNFTHLLYTFANKKCCRLG